MSAGVPAARRFNRALTFLRLAESCEASLLGAADRSDSELVAEACRESAALYGVLAGEAWGELVELADEDPVLAVVLADLEIRADEEGRAHV